ncbi:DUF1801 domain-containing protein [Sphingomonas sp.]|uniref:DUF1801 domain-containing protein n=1 Tax=Sphingomonas sp. TaxID=28214 RepID=UPI001D43FB57|nr:DUF1801 domain-containing protein [Sphingomonas sp.]MBX9797337.1 DUF1801 domain-containing protein [Sphingomonas sp.]
MANKTVETDASVDAYVAQVQPPQRAADAEVLLAMMGRVTGLPPAMWGPSMIGYGRYSYRYESGHSGEMFRVGFAPRKAQLVLYLMVGCGDNAELLARLGKHKTGKGCLYINKLADVDLDVLEQLIARRWDAVNARYPD